MMIKKKLDDRAGLAEKVSRLTPPWPLRMATAATVIALGALSPSGASALGLGRITVLSALGEPLRAEIDIPQITPEEAASLRAGIPAPAAFQAAGMEYNAALSRAQITLQQRPDGRSFLRLTSDRVVTEPFVDLILETVWSTGRVSRDYTLLFDPPGTRQPAPAAPVAAQLTPPRAPDVPATSSRPAPAPSAAAPAPRSPTVSPAKEPARTATPAPAAASDKQIKVQAGDTAGKIAANHKPDEISLDQMLVALLRANPNAFIGGNVNRIKAGALLNLPTAEQAASVTASEARKTLSVQSANFNEFRRKLSEAVPTTQVAAADRQATGSLQARVDDKKEAAASPDKLTLSKGAVKGTVPEAQIAESRQSKEAAERVAELSKNVKDLSRLQEKTTVPAASGAASAASGARGPALPVGAAASAAVAPAAPASAKVSTPSTTTTVAVGAIPPASAASAAASTAASAPAALAASSPSLPAGTATTQVEASTTVAPPAPAASKAPPAPVEKTVVVEEPSFLDGLLDNSVLPLAGGGLLALLAGFGLFRARQRKKATQVDSSFLESRAQPDSFFGSSGGQHIDTDEAPPPGSSLVYSPSQLDAAGDVDPVAEADVYLAYGRDLQAEEILKEALKTNPGRIGIHGKLLEIYAKRRDVRAFEVVAAEAHKLTGGDGSEWDRICELGRELDSENALYQPGAPAESKAFEVEAQAEPESLEQAFSASMPPDLPKPEFSPSSISVDLDLGDLDAEPARARVPDLDLGSPVAATAEASKDDDGGLDWDVLDPGSPEVAQVDVDLPIDISMPELPASQASAPAPAPAPSAAAGNESDAGMIEFDLGSLSLDLEQSSPEAAASNAAPADNAEDPMATKLALAQEFHAIGDSDGARALVEEVVAGSTGPLKAKAQRFLADLG